MKKYLFLILIIAVLSPLFTQAQNAFTINGKLSNKRHPKTAYLVYTLYGEKNRIIDSSDVKNGQFSFKGTVTEPIQAILKIRYKKDTGTAGSEPINSIAGVMSGEINLTCSTCLNDRIILMIGGGPVSVDAADSVKYAKVRGSKLSMDYADVLALMWPLQMDVLRLYKRAAIENQLAGGAQTPRYVALVDSSNLADKKMRIAEYEFAKKHLDTYAGLWAFQQAVGSPLYRVDSARQYFEKFSPEVRATQLGQQFTKGFSKAALTQVGGKFEDFTQPDINGKPFSLSSLKGKYVLIDFWASWCGPCRKELPNLIKAYQTLKGKNLEIVGVSLDKDGDAWREAVKKEGMTWIQVSDLKYFNNALAVKLGIQSIPENVLIDPDGVILGTSIRGEDTEAKLAKLMKVE